MGEQPVVTVGSQTESANNLQTSYTRPDLGIGQSEQTCPELSANHRRLSDSDSRYFRENVAGYLQNMQLSVLLL